MRFAINNLLRVGVRQHLIVVMLCLLSPGAHAVGDFSVRTASAHETDGVIYVDASIDYRLNETAIEALQSGVSLTFELRIEVQRERRWRPDKGVAELLQLYELQYHALSQRFILLNVNSGEQNIFSTLPSALASLGRVEDLPVLDAALLNPKRDYQLRLRAVLDIRSFPGPLRLLSAFFGDWRLASDWYEWRLDL